MVQASQRLCDTQVKNTDPGIRSLDSRPAETLITFMICVWVIYCWETN